MNNPNLFRITKFLSFIILLFLIALFSVELIPYNMDEFCHHHPITSRHYKYNVLNTFRENCRGYDLNFLNTGLVLPLRAYAYEGSFTSLYYYPLFRLWKDPRSARFLGLLALLVQALILARIFNFKYEYILLFLLCLFPYSFQHLVDTGPINYTTTSIFLLFWLLKKWLADTASSGLRWRYPLIVALIVFLGVWAKLTYFWLFAGIGILFLTSLLGRGKFPNRRESVKIGTQLLASAFVLMALLSLILLSTSPQEDKRFPYIEQLTSSKRIPIKQLFQLNFVKELGVVKALFNPFEATQRIFVVKSPNLITKIYSGFILLFVPVCMLICTLIVRISRINWFEKINPWLLYLAGMTTFATAMLTQRAWAMHHTVLAFPFLILSVLSTISTISLLRRKVVISALFIVFALLNSYFFINFPKQPVREHDDWSKIRIHRILQDFKLAEEYFYVVVDWGMYYYQGLYGPESQSVLYIEPLNSQNQIEALKELSKKHNRKLLFVYRDDKSNSDLSLIRNSFQLKEYGTTSSDQIWRIMLEDGIIFSTDLKKFGGRI